MFLHLSNKNVKSLFFLFVWRIGSVIADFKIIIASSIDSQALISNSVKIGQSLSASLIMETSGNVILLQRGALYCMQLILSNMWV